MENPVSGPVDTANSVPLLEVRDLRVTFQPRGDAVRAVNGVSFELRRGEILALVGESGSGKTVTSLSLSRLIPTQVALVTGSVLLDGEDVLGMSLRDLRRVRTTRIGYVFQDPVSSLNPARRIGSQLIELLATNRGLSRAEARQQSIELLEAVGISHPSGQLMSYPHEFSGGMCQRVMIAMALAGEPDVIVADEATSALDVSIQAQILVLLERVRTEFGTSILLVTHDFGVVAGIADRVAVMYGGEMVEIGPTRDVLSHPGHPYTAGLMMSAPDTRNEGEELFMIPGTLDDRREHAGTRCQFAPRCPLSFDQCWAEWPGLMDRGADHRAACWLAENQVAEWSTGQNNRLGKRAGEA